MTLGVVDLSYLTDEEREKILQVIRRDDQLRDTEQIRIRSLKDAVKSLRLKGTIREGRNATKTCARCRAPFGIIFNTGSVCQKCQHRVCKKCQETVPSGSWICVFCFRQMEYEAKSGNWFYSRFPRTMRNRETNEIVSGGKIVQDAISNIKPVGGLECVCDSDTSRPSSLHSANKNAETIQSTNSDAETFHNSSPPRTSPNLLITGDRVTWTADYDTTERDVVIQGLADGGTTHGCSLPTESERNFDASDLISGVEENLDAEEVCGIRRSVISTSSLSPADITNAESCDAISEIDTLTSDFNSAEFVRTGDEDRSPSGVEDTDRGCGDARKICGVYDSNDSAFEDDVDCQVHLGSSYSEILEGSCEDIPELISSDLRNSPEMRNPNTGGTIATDIALATPFGADVFGGDESLPCDADSEDASMKLFGDSGSSEAPVHARLFPSVETVCDNSGCELLPDGATAHGDSYVSETSPMVDLKTEELIFELDGGSEVERVDESENSASGNDLKEISCDGEILEDDDVFESAIEKTVVNNELSFLPATSNDEASSEFLEQDTTMIGQNLELTEIMDLAEPKEEQTQDDHEPQDDRLIMSVVDHERSSSIGQNSASISGKNASEKAEIDVEGPSDGGSKAAVNGAAVRSKVGALLAKYSHHFDSEKDGGNGMISAELSNGLSTGENLTSSPVSESKIGFHDRLTSSPDIGDNFVASVLNNYLENSINFGHPLSISSPKSFPDYSLNQSTNQDSDGVVEGLEVRDLLDEEFGSDGVWDSDFGRMHINGDFDGDMEWDDIDIFKTDKRNGRGLEISGDLDEQTDDLSTIRSMLASCLGDSGRRGSNGSPRDTTEGFEISLENPRNIDHRRKPRRRSPSKSAHDCDPDVGDDDVLSVISEHTEPESDDDDDDDDDS